MLRFLRRTVLATVGVGLGALVGVWLFGERGRLMRPSTWALLREQGWRSLFNRDFLHAYIYGRWTNQYIGWAVSHVFPTLHLTDGDRAWADAYHGKVLPTALAKKLISVEQDIPLQDLEQIIPYATARNLVLHGPPEVAAYECGCRHARENPCQPTQVCLVVGQPFVDFILEHNPGTSRRLTQTEALELLEAEHERGHIHAAYFKDVMLNRFYALCNCCPCCCGGLEAMRRGVPMVASSGYVARVNEHACLGCGTCADACPFEAIEINGFAHVLWDQCMGCGVCEGQCPEGAIGLELDARKGLPLDVEQLTPKGTLLS